MRHFNASPEAAELAAEGCFPYKNLRTRQRQGLDNFIGKVGLIHLAVQYIRDKMEFIFEEKCCKFLIKFPFYRKQFYTKVPKNHVSALKSDRFPFFANLRFCKILVKFPFYRISILSGVYCNAGCSSIFLHVLCSLSTFAISILDFGK